MVLRHRRLSAEPPGYVALLEASKSDRTALRDNADSLLASERKYRLLAENVADVVYLVQDGKIAWVSGSVEQVSGAPPGILGGPRIAEAVPEDWAEAPKGTRPY